MRIGVLTTSYPRTPDDPAGHFVAGFSRWLSENVGEVEVLAASDRRTLFYRGGAPGALRSAGRWPGAVAFSARLFTEAARRVHRWDAIVSHWMVPCGVIAAALAGKRRHLAIAHGSDARLLKRVPGGTRLMRKLGERSNLVFVADALRPPGVRARVQRMGTEPLPEWTKTRARERLRVLFMGRLCHEKGADLAIAGLPEGVELSIAGAGPERVALEEQVRALGCTQSVRFLGEVRGMEKARAMWDADLLIVPSREDGAPTVIAEAQAIGLPILATRVGGVPECVDGEDTLCEPTPEGLRRALKRARECRPVRRSKRPVGWETIGPALWAGGQDRTQCAPLRLVWV